MVQFSRCYNHLASDIYISFDFNGQHFDVKESLSSYEAEFRREDAYKRLFNRIMEQIGLELADKFGVAIKQSNGGLHV